ncbi:MAG TPA: hypothetical protein VNN73_20200 [Blastocatellia bacterium]|nr:hypothetical protein [Blastocatellia bacterium]
MENIADRINVASLSPASGAARAFGIAAMGVTAFAAMLAGILPLQMSIAVVFLFAGPHNWMELRYFLARMPVRWGASRNFFALAIMGVVTLASYYAMLPSLASLQHWDEAQWKTAAATWNSLLILWVVGLIYLRSRQMPRRNWSLAIPIALALVAANWAMPEVWEIALVYLHPVLALWFLDRQLRRSRPAWLAVYRVCLALIPLLLLVLCWRLSNAAPLAQDNGLTLRITQNVGADLFSGISNRVFVAAHVFLETLHYAVWIVALPLIGLSTAPWRIRKIPLVRHRLGWPRAVRSVLILGAFAVLLLWGCFAVDYQTTRDVYFTVAIIHVLAEVPFLLRMI